jgi:hypothetical protein
MKYEYIDATHSHISYIGLQMQSARVEVSEQLRNKVSTRRDYFAESLVLRL